MATQDKSQELLVACPGVVWQESRVVRLLSNTPGQAAFTGVYRNKFRTKPGAEDRIRTDDLLITNELLYHLSYFGVKVVGLCGL